MTTTTNTPRQTSKQLLGSAVHQNWILSADGLRERLFTLFFRSLVYPQIWEDPVVDMEALQLDKDSKVITIASGGCNVLNYLTAKPSHIAALDLNAAHVALNKLKLTAAAQLPDHRTFYRFFGEADCRDNVDAYETYLKPALDPAALHYWEGRDMCGRKRITRFARGFYRFGVLGRFIGCGHLLARLCGIDPRSILAARSLKEQREIFDSQFAPVFDNAFVRWTLNRPTLLYGLGIPPAQYQSLAAGDAPDIVRVIRERLERLACGTAINDNYFAWQAFNRAYAPAGSASVPPYLEEEHFATLKERADRTGIHLVSFTQYLRDQSAASHDCYVLLDAQDWMTDRDLTELWAEITRTAKPGARVIFRTAAESDLLPGRVDADILNGWTYEKERSQDLTLRDRSAIYGGFHLYVAGGADA